MENIFNTVPCRESQLTELYNLLGDYDEPLPYSIFISGRTATGKTVCVETVLGYLGYKSVFINCLECYSLKVIGEMITNSLDSEKRDDTPAKCDSLNDLIIRLNSLQTIYKHYEPIVLVLDKAERLRSMDPTLMCTLLRLREICNLNICTIFITNLIYENFYFEMGLREPIKVYFPNYNKEELFRIIFLHQISIVQHVINNSNVEDLAIEKELKEPEFFGNFLNAYLSVFYRPCRDLIELIRLAKINFSDYCEPIVKNEIDARNLSKLWRHISPILKTSLELLYLRIDTECQAITTSPGKENYDPLQLKCRANTLKGELMCTKTFAQGFELPYYTKFLLIAAYLASYNPPKADKRMFMKNHGKQRKRLQEVNAKAKITEKLNAQLGPKMFTLDRWLAIFFAILEDKMVLTRNLLFEIESLVVLKLVAGAKEVDLDSTKYKCIVSYDFIFALAQTVNFNVRKYLYEFQ